MDQQVRRRWWNRRHAARLLSSMFSDDGARQDAGVWDRLHRLVLDELSDAEVRD